jgi:hypothetical protein
MSGETGDEFVTKLLEMWGPSVETLKLPLGTDATTITGIVTLRVLSLCETKSRLFSATNAIPLAHLLLSMAKDVRLKAMAGLPH